LAWCYLSNMNSLGAEKSVMSIYHGWFRHGSIYDGPNPLGSAPGYLAGGPNQFFSVNWIAPPYGQPPMKAYKDWNAAWNATMQANEASWEITEPAIYYQAIYIAMLGYAMR
jgi:endoglucanase